jgi:hypothetical protein|tara:strand:- start:173 stop:355 length:183 start_codon:yes stop_codon:yes gene_type:complete
MNLDKITKLTGGSIFETKNSNTNNILVTVLLIIGSIYLYTNVKKMYKRLEVVSENSKTKK